MIHNQNGADMLELSVVNPYPADYEASVDRANEERENQEFQKSVQIFQICHNMTRFI
ncbi:hypothetical protein GQR36_03330 [Enterococcus termitis]